MADLIDRQTLGIGTANPLVFDKPEYAHGWNCAVEIVRNAPSVDAEEVVRCKDCVSGHKQLYGDLFRCNVMGCGGLKPDDFCSYGERKEDNAAN